MSTEGQTSEEGKVVRAWLWERLGDISRYIGRADERRGRGSKGMCAFLSIR
jgi:hypothetical protein